MTDLLNTPVGELVAADGRRATLFDRLGLDYCCGGDRTLREACRKGGLDPGTVVAALDALDATAPAGTADTDWRERPLAELLEHIVDTHHAYLRRELPDLAALFRRVARVHGEESGWLHEAREVFQRLRLEIGAHTENEETTIFPLIRAMEAGEPAVEAREAGAMLADAEAEHEEAGDALRRLRSLSDDFTPPDRACASFRRHLDGLEALESDMHRHVHEENNILFPRARRLAAEEGAARG